MEQRQAIVLTTYGLLKGLILQENEDGICILVNGSRQTIASDDIRTIATV